MLKDSYKRKIDYLRISVTDRCNLRCIYCMPEDGITQKAPWDILTFEEIARFARIALSVGIDKIRLTGGEPLVRKGLPRLIKLLSLSGLKDLSLTTNGTLLAKHAGELKEAGLRRLNVSIDTLDSRKFHYVTRGGRIEDSLEGLNVALELGFLVKINMVVMKGLNDNEILDFVQLGQEKRVIVRFIELMPMVNSIDQNTFLYSGPYIFCGASKGNIEKYDSFVSCGEIKESLEVLGKLKELKHDTGLGNGPAQYYTIEGLPVAVGFISPISHKFCSTCNRLRLTSEGLLMSCLGNSSFFDLKKPLREGKVQEVRELIEEAIYFKPQEHNFTSSAHRQCLMSQIGG